MLKEGFVQQSPVAALRARQRQVNVINGPSILLFTSRHRDCVREHCAQMGGQV